MSSFYYFFTPVGPEYKKKFSRNVGIALLILFAFYGIWYLSAELSSEPESELERTSRYEKYLDENNELNFGLQYDTNGVIIDDLQRIHDWCDYSGEKPAGWYFDWNNASHHINSKNCEWIENEKKTELFKDTSEVKAFYAKYDDASVSVRDDHISYFAGNEDDWHVRMNMFFDENYDLDYIDFHCYFQREHQFEFAQEDIVSKLEKYECKKYGT